MIATFPATRRLLRRLADVPIVASCALIAGLFFIEVPYIEWRSVADNWRAPADGAVAERALFGTLPSAWLQAHLYSGQYGWFEHVAVYTHGSWFVIPPLVTILIATRFRSQFASYALWHMLAFYLAAVAFTFLPVSPPWMADPHVARILANHWGNAAHLDSNPVAAFPSLHVALPLTIAAWSWAHSHRLLAAVAAVYSLLIAFAVVFMGEHYMIDVFGAVGLTCVVALIGTGIERLAARARLWRFHPAIWTAGSAGLASERGQGILEFALIAPFMLIFLFIIVDFGFGINNRVIVTNAAREAARYGVTGHSVSDIQTRAVQQTQGLVKDPNDVQVTFYDTNGNGVLDAGDSLAVKIVYNYKLFSPLPLFAKNIPTSFNMSACTDMRMETVPSGATIASGGSPCA